eukprot:superscaffoldBa00009275_g23983
MLGPSQSQHSSLPVSNPMSATSHFEPSPSAARQLQIIALSSGRQPQPGTYGHATVQSAVASPELSSQSKRTLSSEDVIPLPLNPSLPKTNSPLPSPPSLLSPASPPSQAGPQTQTLVQKGGEAKESEEQRERGRGVRQGIGDEGRVGQDLRVEKDDQREKGKEERQRLAAEKDGSLVNRSSLLVPEQVTKPQEVNGTNGKAALPVTQCETNKQAEPSTDSEEEGGDTDDPGTKSGQRDRAVLHCQFCGKRGHAHNFMRSKRFCSTSCARGFNVRLTKRLRALSAGSRTERPRPALNRAESVPGKPLLLRLVGRLR